MLTKTKATTTDLYQIPENGKAEIVNGEIIQMSPTGDEPARAGGKIYTNLDQYERRTRLGYAYPDNVGFKVSLPNRESFSPDAAFYIGKRSGMKFLNGAPVFAVEVRSETDYGPQAEKAMADKRRDYFIAGTLVVWDVNLLSNDVIKVYRADDPTNPTIYRRGELAEAEPALPGWNMPVNDLFA